MPKSHVELRVTVLREQAAESRHAARIADMKAEVLLRLAWDLESDIEADQKAKPIPESK